MVLSSVAWARSFGVERCRRHSFAQDRRAIGVAESRGDTVCRFVELAVQARADDFCLVVESYEQTAATRSEDFDEQAQAEHHHVA